MRRLADKKKAIEKAKALGEVAERFKAFRPAREVLKVVRAVPTRFVQFDHATRVGGMPIERYSLVHGPSNQGKSLHTLGLVDSFLAADHFALYLDAERTTPITWAAELMGEERANHPRFFADRPETYEKTIDRVREFLNIVADLRAKGKVAPQTSAIVVCDSLRKLVPEGIMKEIIKHAKEDVGDGRPGARGGKKSSPGRDRAGQIKAKMNAAWCDELVPLLEHAQACFVAIAREMKDPNADQFAQRYGTDYLIGGGGTIYYDASLVIRIERASWVGEEEGEGEKKTKKIYGERHRVTIRKTKIAGKDGKVVTSYFHSSNGTLIAPGFDRARDVVELGRRFGVVGSKARGWLNWGSRRWQGEHAAVRKLSADAGMLAELEAEVRSKFEVNKPTEVDEQTGEVE